LTCSTDPYGVRTDAKLVWRLNFPKAEVPKVREGATAAQTGYVRKAEADGMFPPQNARHPCPKQVQIALLVACPRFEAAGNDATRVPVELKIESATNLRNSAPTERVTAL
jgi:hypothetical protein